MRYVALLMFSLSALAQSKSVITPEPTTIVTYEWPQQARWSDKITKDGHYVATMDDPNNAFRCDVTSYIEKDPRNAFGSDVTSFTIVCTKKREPTQEK